jgi:hypothetical protein
VIKQFIETLTVIEFMDTSYKRKINHKYKIKT